MSRLYSGNMTGSRDDFLWALELYPNDPALFGTHGMLAIGYFLMDEFDQAIAHAKSALLLRNGYGLGHYVLICSYMSNGLTAEAVKAFKTDAGQVGEFSYLIKHLPFKDEAMKRRLATSFESALQASQNALS